VESKSEIFAASHLSLSLDDGNIFRLSNTLSCPPFLDAPFCGNMARPQSESIVCYVVERDDPSQTCLRQLKRKKGWRNLRTIHPPCHENTLPHEADIDRSDTKLPTVLGVFSTDISSVHKLFISLYSRR
jgi:hypothetical protein